MMQCLNVGEVNFDKISRRICLYVAAELELKRLFCLLPLGCRHEKSMRSCFQIQKKLLCKYDKKEFELTSDKPKNR